MHLAVQFGWLSISSPPQVTRWPWPSWQSARGRASEVPLPADLLGTHLVNEMQSMCIRLYLSGFQQTWPHGASRPLKSLRRHRGRSASFPVACSDCIVCIITCFKASGCERLCGCGHRRVGRGSAAVGALDFPVHRRGYEKSRRRADFPICFFFLDKSSAAVAECALSLCFPKTFCFTFLVFVFEESCSPACTPVSFWACAQTSV